MPKPSTISSKGQITIPLEVRTRLGVKPGDKVHFAFQNGLTVLRPTSDEDDPFEQFAGSLPAFTTIEESNAWLRDLRGHRPDDL